MKLKSILRSSHDLKKNGYKIIRKLHKLEHHKGANQAYSSVYEDSYFFILSVRALADIIKLEYPFASSFSKKCDSFITYLECVSTSRGLINKSVLASFLKAYTHFFNCIIELKIDFTFNEKIVGLWNNKCLMAYIATWGNN
ncbi:MAG: hypothetical protein IJ784_01445 [Ruminiclostridium sp.]|uniref:hypothetical protein n=1 Tax=Ruminococcus sp. TaxID=41978 RepID=UPI0025D47CAF|nr:hypothetical protein [Ruminococcus sp.]MBR1432258.1 hypothetical protein [Ruminococcus sp.]MBR1831080.1 hypothetical protein [Ruminiclostridium sp.]